MIKIYKDIDLRKLIKLYLIRCLENLYFNNKTINKIIQSKYNIKTNNKIKVNILVYNN